MYKLDRLNLFVLTTKWVTTALTMAVFKVAAPLVFKATTLIVDRIAIGLVDRARVVFGYKMSNWMPATSTS